jgi:acetyl-CoA carboxylase carboxyltransferase component
MNWKIFILVLSITDNVVNNMERVEELKQKMHDAKLGGGLKRIERQHQKGKLTARERLQILLDPDSFVELDAFVVHQCTDFGIEKRKVLGDGVVTGYGTIDSRLVYVYSQDFTFIGGSLGEMHAKKICKVMDLALKMGAPIIGLNDSGGARIQEGVSSLNGYGEIFYRNVMASGAIPQIVIIMGPCAGGAVYSPALMDFIFMVNGTSNMFITGPNVIKTVTGEEITSEQLGGALTHAQISGVTSYIAENDEKCLEAVKKLLSYLPSKNLEEPPRITVNLNAEVLSDSELLNIIPTNPRKTYNMYNILNRVLDSNTFFEMYKLYAPNVVVGFARLNGRSIGVIANQPIVSAGCLDVNASDKIARFVRFCDAFNIPLLTFVDVPGYLPGIRQEHWGIIRHGAKVIYAYSEATVPKITVVLRKAYGGGYIAMCSKSLRADIVFAWPTAQISVMGPEGAVNIIFRKKIAEAEKPEEYRENRIKEFREKFANPYVSASKGFIDQVIDPRETRSHLIRALDALMSKRSIQPRPRIKHGNVPM